VGIILVALLRLRGLLTGRRFTSRQIVLPRFCSARERERERERGMKKGRVA